MKYLVFLSLLIFTFFSPLFVTSATAQDNNSVPTIFYCVGSNLGPPCTTIAPTEPPVINPTTVPTTPAATTISPTNESGTPAEPTSSSTTPSASASPTVDPCEIGQQVETQSTITIQSKEKERNDDNKKRGHQKKHSHKKGLLQQLLEFLLKLIQTLLQFIGIQLPGSSVPCPQSTGPINNSTPSCKPRPACLDSNPRCMIPETSDMCPPQKNNASSSGQQEGKPEDPTPTIFN